MMRSMFAGVSGLKVHQTRMDSIGNNIANVNTTGFKYSRTTFADAISQNMGGAAAPNGARGGVNPKQVGLGVGVASIDLMFTDGVAQGTGKNTDIALKGNGLFVMKNGGSQMYTRNGAFEFDANGTYGLPGSGYKVQGWMAGPDGSLSTSGAAGDITIQKNKGMDAKASSRAAYSGNLNAAAPTIVSLSGGTLAGNVYTASKTKPVTLVMSDGSKRVQTAGAYEKGHSLPVATLLSYYDSEGVSHEVPVYLTKIQTNSNGSAGAADGDIWQIQLMGAKSDPPHESTGILGNETWVKEKDGTFTHIKLDADVKVCFDVNGAIKPVGGSGAAKTSFPMSITLANGAGSYAPGSQNHTGAQNVTLDFSAITQYAGTSTIVGKTDGYAAGTLTSVSIDSSGIITGVYSNSERRTEAQLAVASFNNASGLTKIGNSMYQESNNSGVANIKTAADLGVEMQSSSLELSNVDIANEFSDMIVTQRGYQSNSKIITVSDEMLETLINMKR